MHKAMIAVAVLATAGIGSAAQAQQRGGYAVGAPNVGFQQVRPGIGQTVPQQGRWGQAIGGRWYAGARAPGGWHSYRRPTRGWSLPQYWISPDFYIADYATYGLSQPAYGYSWTRYYDDAVLVDSRGKVWDSVSGVNWDGGYAEGYAPDGYAPEGYAPQGYAQVPIQGQGGYYPPQRSNNGVGGAVAGAVVGGVAGNLIAGRGNRLAGTLVGAGVGAVAGAAIDKSSHRAYAPTPGYGAGYPQPGYGAGYPQGGVVYAPPQEIVQPAVSGSYYTGYAGAGAAQIVQGPPVITEVTTTTYIEEQAPVTYHRTVVRRAPVKHYHPVRRQCTCSCGC